MDELPYHKPQTTKFYHDTLTSANISPSQCEKSCSRQYNVSITCVAAAQRRRRQGRRAEAGTVMAWSPTPTTRGRTRRRPAQRGWRGGARRDAGAAPGGGRRRGGGDVCSGGGTGGRSDGGERGGAQDDEGGGEATGPALPAVVTSAVKVGDRRVRRRRATAARGGLAGVRRALGAAVDAQSVSYVNNYA